VYVKEEAGTINCGAGSETNEHGVGGVLERRVGMSHSVGESR